MEVSTVPPLPSGTKPLSHQVAGHFHGRSKTKLGLLEDADGTILKPVQSPPRGERECKFYEDVFRNDCSDPWIIPLRSFMPTYMGTWTSVDQPGVTYFRLEDITRKFRKPCILDVKVGPVTYDPEATPEKIEREKRKYPPVEKTGFQLTGLRTFVPSTNEYVLHDRVYLRSLDEEELFTKGICVYLNKKEDIHPGIIKAFLKKLSQIETWFEGQTKFSFYASSLLLVYDADLAYPSRVCCQGDQSCSLGETCNGRLTGLKSTDNSPVPDQSSPLKNDLCSSGCTSDDVTGRHGNCSTQPDTAHEHILDNAVDVRMIDFAHVFPTDKTDHNYLTGLRGLVRYLRRILTV